MPTVFSPPLFTWMNGVITPYAESLIHVNTDAVLRGASVFEGLRAYRSVDGDDLLIVRPREHFARLFNTSMRVLRMESPYGPEDLVEAAAELLRSNAIRCDAHIRIVVYFSGAELGEDVDTTGTFILAYERPQSPKLQVGVTSTISTWRRLSDLSLAPRVKASANYLNGRLASRDARAKGFDVPIQLNDQGTVSEGPGQNVFLVRDGLLITPRLTDGILEGITRQIVIDLAADIGIPVEVRAVDPTELYVADELFFAGTLIEIQPINSIDHYRVGDGSIGPVTKTIQDLYLQFVRGGNGPNGLHSVYTTQGAAQPELAHG